MGHHPPRCLPCSPALRTQQPFGCRFDPLHPNPPHIPAWLPTGSCNWAKVAAAGTLQQMHGKISSLETAAADVAAVLPQLPALSRLAVDCQEAHLGGPPLLDVAGVLPELTALECVSLHGAATWAAEQHEFEGLVGALCELPRLQECSLRCRTRVGFLTPTEAGRPGRPPPQPSTAESIAAAPSSTAASPLTLPPAVR